VKPILFQNYRYLRLPRICQFCTSSFFVTAFSRREKENRLQTNDGKTCFCHRTEGELGEAQRTFCHSFQNISPVSFLFRHVEVSSSVRPVYAHFEIVLEKFLQKKPVLIWQTPSFLSLADYGKRKVPQPPFNFFKLKSRVILPLFRLDEIGPHPRKRI